MPRLLTVLTVSLLSLLLASGALAQSQSACAQSDASAGITRQQADAILEELRSIHRLLERDMRSAPPPRTSRSQIHLKLDPVSPSLGRDDAPLTLVQFNDYECPYCRRFHAETFAQLKKTFVDTGILKIVIRDLPLPMHRNAVFAAEAAHCAGEQGKFWPFHELLMNGKGELSMDTFVAYGQEIGLRGSEFKACIETHKFKAEIEKSSTNAMAAEVSGTPTFILGKTTQGDFSGDVLTGALPYSLFEKAIRNRMEIK